MNRGDREGCWIDNERSCTEMRGSSWGAFLMASSKAISCNGAIVHRNEEADGDESA